MAREIASSVQTEFHPLVGLREKGNYVKGKVVEFGKTTNDNPVVTLELIDLEGSTSKSVSKGVYEEVEVSPGDLVQLIATGVQLKDKLPKLAIGDIATITFTGKTKVPKGSRNNFKVEVE